MDTAFEQIRHYVASDAPVTLRLLRAMDDIARNAREPEVQESLQRRARRIVEGCEGRMQEQDLERLRERLCSIDARIRDPGTHHAGGLTVREIQNWQ